MMRNPKNYIPLEGGNKILIGVNGILLSELVMPNILIKVIGIKYVIPIIMITMNILVWSTIGMLKKITGKKLKPPIKYEFLFLLLSIPLLYTIDKFLSGVKNYYQKLLWKKK